MRNRPRGTGTVNSFGHIRVGVNNKAIFAHVIIAEEVLGRKLPHKAVVHHADGDPGNNNKSNLVICPNQKYHFLLHQRERALNECGDANKRKCHICKEYDNTESLYINCRDESYHRECKAGYEAIRKAQL